MRKAPYLISALVMMFLGAAVGSVAAQGVSVGNRRDGQHLFERETFGGNGRTCLTCHSRETGTVSPQDAQRRLAANPADPLFVHDGSDDGNGNGTTRMTTDATVLMKIPLPDNVKLADDPTAEFVILRRGIPTTLNTPALDPVLMLDGRQPTLELQATGAIQDHAQATVFPTGADLERIKQFQMTDAFFSSPALRDFARGGPAPGLPEGVSDSEKRGRRFFEDVVDFVDAKHGLCAACHSGPMLNETNFFFFLISGVPPQSRFQTVLVSELNAAHNPELDYIFTNPDGTETPLRSSDPGRSLITGTGETLTPSTLARPPIFVPETARISALLREFQRSRQQLAIVVNEYGGAEGLVTIEDVVEEIVGDIQPEGPGAASLLITRLPDGSAIVDGTTRLDDLRRVLGIAVDDSDTYMTAAGLVIAALDSIPAPGASVVRSGHRWTVLEADGPRVTKLRLQPEP